MLLSTLGIAVLLYAAWLILLYTQQSRMLFPGAYFPAPEATLPAGGERVWFEHRQARVEAWYLPPADQSGAPGPALIYAHGNGEFINNFGGRFEALRRAEVAVLLVEYPGYGDSSGTPSQANVTALYVQAYDWLAARPAVDENRIVGMGRSLGGGVVAALADRRPLAAIVLQSTFTSVRSMARRYLAPGFLVRNPFDTLAALRDYSGPVHVSHGRWDNIISYDHGQKLAAAAGADLLSWDCAHNDCPPDWEAYLEQILAFLRGNGVLESG